MSEADGIDLDCGIAYRRMAAWLNDELGLGRYGGGWLYCKGPKACRIQAEPLESRVLGAVSLERTHLMAQGDAEALESFQRAFTLRFMSAGG